MPYRRLPNTDQARIRALKVIVEKGNFTDMYDLPFSIENFEAARDFLPKFERACSYYHHCYENQSSVSKQHQPRVKMAHLYISHFIQVFNFAVIRSEIKAVDKKLYGLSPSENNLPDLSSDQSLVDWGSKIIEGEKQRTALGGLPIYSPTIAKVRVHYDIFVDSYQQLKNCQLLTNRSLEKISLLRPEANQIILNVWNEVEAYFKDIAKTEERLDKCRNYGLVYYYRPKEKK